jgi:hypothetical protein
VNQTNYEFFQWFTCPFFSNKCGQATNVIVVDSTQILELTAIGLASGDVCYYEVQYGAGLNTGLKIIADTIVDIQVTIVDGLNGNPFVTATNFTNFVSKIMVEGDEFEFADTWFPV